MEEPTKHEVLSLHLTNMTMIQQKVTREALIEHADLVQRCRMLESVNTKLYEDVAKLTLKQVNGGRKQSAAAKAKVKARRNGR